MSNKSLAPLMTTCIFTLTLISCTGCYRMPGEDDYSVVPTTNNPSVTCEKNDNIMPAVKY